MSLQDLGISFSSSRADCPISYKLVELKNGVENVFSGLGMQIDASSGEVSIDTSIPFEFEGFIRAYTYGQDMLDSDLIEFQVCGNEAINYQNSDWWDPTYV